MIPFFSFSFFLFFIYFYFLPSYLLDFSLLLATTNLQLLFFPRPLSSSPPVRKSSANCCHIGALLAGAHARHRLPTPFLLLHSHVEALLSIIPVRPVCSASLAHPRSTSTLPSRPSDLACPHWGKRVPAYALVDGAGEDAYFSFTGANRLSQRDFHGSMQGAPPFSAIW